mmetsp:Transcript_45988/g.106949  ORF Transcript_45988/g.106949 Transcript_45988/m.106949 type:complete len:105 (-) Transcript_45988:42-356(-)
MTGLQCGTSEDLGALIDVLPTRFCRRQRTYSPKSNQWRTRPHLRSRHRNVRLTQLGGAATLFVRTKKFDGVHTPRSGETCETVLLVYFCMRLRPREGISMPVLC